MSSAAPVRQSISRFDADAVAWSTNLLERDVLPDWLIRIGIRRLLRARLREESAGGIVAQQERMRKLIADLKQSPIAVETQAANQQHYEVPARFYELVLGRLRKYSSGLWEDGCQTLDDAEQAMLSISIERAQLEDGHDILELGCGWGSLTLYMAERFPKSRIIAVSNSSSQRHFIEEKVRERGLSNVTVITSDINHFDPYGTFDRVVSVEMFEHMRNYQLLLGRIASWMRQDALLFVHIFAHRLFAYPFEARDASDWMAEHFFTGGIMPSHALLLNFQDHVKVAGHWWHSGTHYQKTAQAWLNNMDAHRHQIHSLFRETYGASEATKVGRDHTATRWIVRWRVFFMACEELWGYRNGQEWGVTHLVFRNSSRR
jgi:cyclopropane-fatty-acyl-phospholipid synthase